MSFLSISGLYGGCTLILDPSGALMKMPVSVLEHSPFRTFLIPGLILVSLLGVIPGILSYALVLKPGWKKVDGFNIYKTRHWAWTYSLFVAIGLILWMDFQIMMLGYGMFIQSIYAFLGVALLIFTLAPGVMKYYDSKV